jgi:hypothetical protein
LSPPETFEYGAKVIERIPNYKTGHSIPAHLGIILGNFTQKIQNRPSAKAFNLRKQKNLLYLSFVDIR